MYPRVCIRFVAALAMTAWVAHAHAELAVSPPYVRVGVVDVGSAGTSSFTVTNDGATDAAATVVGEANVRFAATPSDFVVSAGGSQVVTITFAPTAVGPEFTDFTVTNDVPSPPLVVPASGVGRMNPTSIPATGTGQFAVSSNQDGDYDIYVMEEDGSLGANLTNTAHDEFNPRWSPDGQKILFASYDPDARGIYVMRADGSDVRRLTTAWPGLADGVASWSRDGSQIAYMTHWGGAGHWDIVSILADGAGATRVTSGSSHDGTPVWMLSGAIVYDNNADLRRISADRALDRKLFASVGIDQWAAVTPTEDRVAWQGLRDGNWNIYVAGIDGRNERQLTTAIGSDTYPDWSPDQSRIAYLAGSTLSTIKPDGTDLRPVSSSLTINSFDWSPVAVATIVQVVIDVKPGSDKNPINLRSRGTTPVAILSTQTGAGEAADFDATTVDADTVRAGASFAAAEHAAVDDIDSDGDNDLILHFRTQELGVVAGDDQLRLTGATRAGVEIEGADVITTVGNGPRGAPRLVGLGLGQNYPNPFNPETWIPFELARDAEVSLRVYDLAGNVVRTLDLGSRRVGLHTSRDAAAYWDGRNAQGEPVSSGVYVYELTAGDERRLRRMTVRK